MGNDAFIVRHQSIPAVSDGSSDRAIINKFASQVCTDLILQFLLSGYVFHMQTGTEDAPVTTNGPLDDTKPIMVADCTSGAMMAILYEVSLSAHGTSTLIQAMLEADMDKARYSSGGTAFVPEQMNSAATGAAAANGTFYEISGGDITALAKSTVPASIEIARKSLSEDAIGDPAGAQMAIAEVFSIRNRLSPILTNPGSLCGHFGSATADVTGYASLDFAQFPAANAW